MKVKRKSNQESMIGQFPEWRDSKVVEIFKDGVSHGLYMMCRFPEGRALVCLESGTPWSGFYYPDFDKADYAIEVKGKFVEE